MAVRMFLKRELTEVADDDICTVRPEVDGVVASSDANCKPEPRALKSEETPSSTWKRGVPAVFEYDRSPCRRDERAASCASTSGCG
jgi:hypothetical protein